jgi:hypothetical protein
MSSIEYPLLYLTFFQTHKYILPLSVLFSSFFHTLQVIQLETAMGAAIECFANSAAVCVPRDRFAPVKKCSDLLMLRSDCYTVTPDARLVLSNGVAKAPEMNLDGKK